MTLHTVIEGILRHEGGYVDNPDDAGGVTNWGITQRVARAHGYEGDMRDLPRKEAVRILEVDYWFKPRFDRVAAVSMPIAVKLADTGVNMGPSFPIRSLQRWLNVFNQKETLYVNLPTDGVIGDRTVDALARYLQVRGKDGEHVLLKGLNCSQGHRYLELAEGREANETFVYGWMKNRVNL